MNEPIAIEAAIPRKAFPAMAPRLVAFRSNEAPQAGRTSCRITNENAEAMSEMQLATKRRRGFIRSFSEDRPAIYDGGE